MQTSSFIPASICGKRISAERFPSDTDSSQQEGNCSSGAADPLTWPFPIDRILSLLRLQEYVLGHRSMEHLSDRGIVHSLTLQGHSYCCCQMAMLGISHTAVMSLDTVIPISHETTHLCGTEACMHACMQRIWSRDLQIQLQLASSPWSSMSRSRQIC